MVPQSFVLKIHMDAGDNQDLEKFPNIENHNFTLKMNIICALCLEDSQNK